ncbi:MAG: restriction endonuclease subunit S [Clostridiales bacterium]|nr:restriction endonuclease subunit S [Clostridiales bacterium]
MVDILGSIDAKIENNELLAKKILHFYMAQYHELLAKATQTVHLDEIATIESGKRPPIKMNVASGGCETPIIGASTIMGFTNTYLYDEPILIIGRVGTHGIVQISKGKSFPSDNTLIIKSEYYTFCYCLLNEIDYNALNKGSTQPLITQTDIKKLFVLLPDDKDLIKFESNNKLDYIISLQEENKKLQELKVLYLKKFFE